MSTLLLNADYNVMSISPLSVISWQNAVKLYFTEAAEIVDSYDNWVIHSPSTEFKVPAVMALKTYAKFSRAVKMSTRNIYIRDEFTCRYCNTVFEPKLLSKDHVVPRKNGGKTKWDNIVTACKVCNQKRGHNENIRPLVMPWKPTIYELEAKMLKNPVVVQHESWIPFLEIHWDPELLIKGYE